MKFQAIISLIFLHDISNCEASSSGELNELGQIPQNLLAALNLTPNTGCTYNEKCTDEFSNDVILFSQAVAGTTIQLTPNLGIIKNFTITFLRNSSMKITQNVCSTPSSDNTSRRDTVGFTWDNLQMSLETADITLNEVPTLIQQLAQLPGLIVNNICTKPVNFSTIIPTISIPPLLSKTCLNTPLSIPPSLSLSSVFSTVLTNIMFGLDGTVQSNGNWTVNFAGVVNEDTVVFYNNRCASGSEIFCNCVLTNHTMRTLFVSAFNAISSCLIQKYSETPELNFFICPM